MRRASSKRVKTGCLTCRRRHYKCDEGLPRCFNCRRSNLTCEWGPKRPAGAPESSLPSAAASPQSVVSSRHSQAGSSSMAPGYPANPEHSLTTHDIELITHFVSHFHEHNFQICAWTNLITIPHNSAIPNILRSPSRAVPGKTNWATFYLTRLTLLTPDDPLAVAMSAFTAVRMGFDRTALYLYSKGIMLLRAILTRKNANSMNDRDFLRIWATTLLLAEYESQMGEETLQYQHLAGATTLSTVAMSRFMRSPKTKIESPNRSLQVFTGGKKSASSPSWSSAGSTPSVSPSGQHTLEDPFNDGVQPNRPSSTPLINKESMSALPGYLMALTLRLNHSKAIRESRDTEWPSFHSPADRQGFGAVLDKVAECYKVVMPLVAAYYGRMATHPPKTREGYIEMMTNFAPDVKLAKTAIAEYQSLLENFKGYEHQIFQSCARDRFPFSPVLKFVNPQMAQPMTGPHMFIMFMAPFITEKEHYEAIRYISGVFAGFHDTPGLMLDASYPDIHVAAFWKKGAQRQYFIGELSRRGGAFEIVLTRIWNIVDSAELMKNRELTPTEILGISLKEYHRAQVEGQKLKNTRH